MPDSDQPDLPPAPSAPSEQGKERMIHVSEKMCCVCKTAQAVAFWPCIDPDIRSHPYCRKCLDKAQTSLLIELYELGNPPVKPRSKPKATQTAATGQKQRRGRRGAELIGRAFRCPDGVVRWVTGFSASWLLTVLWLQEETGIWFWGGRWKPDAWPGGEDYPVPAIGTRIRKGSVLGQIYETEVTAEHPIGGFS